MIANEELESKLKHYIEHKIDYDEMYDVMFSLVENALNYLNFRFQFNRESTLLDTTEFCMTKIERFEFKSSAFNFFTTISLCFIRQITRSVMNYSEIKTKYQEFLISQRQIQVA